MLLNKFFSDCRPTKLCDGAQKCRARQNKINGRVDPKIMWDAVRMMTGRKQKAPLVEGMTADSLNQHYVQISTDSSYQEPSYKHTAGQQRDDCQYMTEWRMFKTLDSLHHTSTGMDQLPAWFLHLGAPVFCRPLATLFNLSVSTSVVPRQWKAAVIRPIPKIAAAQSPADFRPISITSVLSRIMEKSIVRSFLYAAFRQPIMESAIADQYAFRPTGSTTAALISLLHRVTQMLITNSYVVVIAMDYSKAFDTVRHITLLEKMANLDLPDHVFNWLVNFFSE